MIAAAILSPCVSVLPVMLLGATSVQLADDLHVDPATLGILATTFFLASALFSFVAARTVEIRLGAGTSMRIAAVCSAGALLGVASISDRWAAVPFLVIAGLANALAQPAANLLVARRVPPARQGFYFAVKQSAVIGASMLAGVSVPTLVVHFGWRVAYVAAAGLALAAVWVAPAHIPGTTPADGPQGAARLARRGPMLVLAAAVGVGAAAVAALPAFLVSAASEIGISDAHAGTLLAVAGLCGIVSRLAVGRAADFLGGEPLKGVAAMLIAGSVGLALLASTGPAFIVGAFVAYAFGWGWPGLFHFGIVRHNRDVPSIATGVTQTGVYIGGVVGPALFGVIAEGRGFSTAWLVVAGLMAVSAAGIRLGAHLLARPEAEVEAVA